jgi:hypothetical protein
MSVKAIKQRNITIAAAYSFTHLTTNEKKNNIPNHQMTTMKWIQNKAGNACIT